jgi:hypothetical protein
VIPQCYRDHRVNERAQNQVNMTTTIAIAATILATLFVHVWWEMTHDTQPRQ